jgi:inward rectifier potassium channel
MFKQMFKDTYHDLLMSSWLFFFCLIFSSYIVLNICFGLVFALFPYSFVIPAHLADYPPFVAGFFMSIQTVSTIGYGGMLPNHIFGEIIMAVESLIGLLFTAVSTGLTFARLSQPSAQILFADIFLHTETDRGPALVFRVANARGNDIINAKATLSVLTLNQKSGNLNMVGLHDLQLKRDQSPTFYLNWVLIHHLDEASPLSGYSSQEILAPDMIYILNIFGHDSSFNQTVFQYRRYSGIDGRSNRYFEDMIFSTEEGQTMIRLENLSELKK